MLEQPVDAAVPFLHVHVTRAQHWRERERNEQRNQHAEGDDDREGAQELADDSGDENHWCENRNQRKRRCDHRECDLPAAFERRLTRVRDEVLAVPVDVLQHHDGVVDHDPDEQQQGKQGHRIEGVAEEVHHRDRAKQRHRNRRGDDHRGAETLQKQPHDERSEQRALDQVTFQRIDHLADENRVVLDVMQFETGRQLGPDLALDPLAHALDDLHRVGVGHFHDSDADGRLAVEARELAEIREAVLDFRDVAQAHRCAVPVGND